MPLPSEVLFNASFATHVSKSCENASFPEKQKKKNKKYGKTVEEKKPFLIE